MRLIIIALALCASVGQSANAEPQTVCSIVIDDTGQEIVNVGDCKVRQSPASTFKIALSVMAYDAGILKDEHTPQWPFKDTYAAWRGEWKQPSDPARWMKLSVVWFSQEITKKLGTVAVQRYLEHFNYGNQDMSGHPGGKGLTNAWLGSSLKISPFEQVTFLRRLVTGALPVNKDAIRHTSAIMRYGQQASGWQVYGKTGAGAMRDKKGKMITRAPFGWFVGWAEKEGRKVFFARLIQFDTKPSGSPGVIARDGVLVDYFGSVSAL